MHVFQCQSGNIRRIRKVEVKIEEVEGSVLTCAAIGEDVYICQRNAGKIYKVNSRNGNVTVYKARKGKTLTHGRTQVSLTCLLFAPLTTRIYS